MIPYEALSRLLDDELPPAEAAALRQRIAEEPAVAAAWAQLQALPAALGALPLEAPPPGLFSAPPAPPSTVRPPKRRPLFPALGAAGLLSAALALLALLPADPPRLVLQSGVQQVDGAVELVAGGFPVHLDGVARIEVEPPSQTPPRAASKEDPMLKSATLGAIAGAVVTIAVYEGKATIEGPTGPTTLQAGETQTLRAPAGDEGPAVARRDIARAPLHDLPALQAEVVALREENDRLRTEAALARGQLSTHEGVPQAWPPTLPTEFQPAAWEAKVRAAVAGVPGVAVERVDCEEFPCITVLTAAGGDSPEAKDRFEGLLQTLAPRDSHNAVAAWVSEQRAEGDAPPKQVFAFVNVPGDHMNPDVQLRTKFRVDTTLEELGEGNAP